MRQSFCGNVMALLSSMRLMCSPQPRLLPSSYPYLLLWHLPWKRGTLSERRVNSTLPNLKCDGPHQDRHIQHFSFCCSATQISLLRECSYLVPRRCTRRRSSGCGDCRWGLPMGTADGGRWDGCGNEVTTLILLLIKQYLSVLPSKIHV